MKRRERGTERAGATVRYDPESERVIVWCANRAEFHLPIEAFKAVARGTPHQRASVTLSEDGDGIRWDAFDVDYYWPFLMAVMLGSAARASRANGAKGGRQRKRRAAS